MTLGYLIWSRRQPALPAVSVPDRPAEKPAFKQLLAACISGNPGQARQAVINWTAALLPEARVVSLAQVVTAFDDDPALSKALRTLDTALYSPAAAGWDGAELADTARRLRRDHGKQSEGEDAALRLYPQGA